MKVNTTVSKRTEYALQMTARGWHVFPCKARGKAPLLKGWQTSATTDSAKIGWWWERHPDANIGIKTGDESNVVVLDFDPKHGGDATLAKLADEHPEIMETFRVKSGGGGWHLYFLHPAGGTVTKSEVMPGMDVRGTGGLIIAPGSIHENGQPYQIDSAADLLELPTPLLPFVEKRTYEGTYERTEEQQKSNVGTTEEQQKQSVEPQKGPSRKRILKSLDLEQLTDEQKQGVLKSIERSVPTAPGRRNGAVLTLARWLLAVDGIDQTIDPDSFRPIVQRWHNMALESAEKYRFRIEGSFVQTMDDFRYAFKNAKCPMNTAMAGIVAEVLDEIREQRIPEMVSRCVEALGCDRDETTLVHLCWHLHHLWELEGFPLACRAGADAIETIGTSQVRSLQWVNRKLEHLVRDGVLRCLERSKPGQRGKASRYLWTWTPPAKPQPKLDWLTGGKSVKNMSAAEQISRLKELKPPKNTEADI